MRYEYLDSLPARWGVAIFSILRALANLSAIIRTAALAASGVVDAVH